MQILGNKSRNANQYSDILWEWESIQPSCVSLSFLIYLSHVSISHFLFGFGHAAHASLPAWHVNCILPHFE